MKNDISIVDIQKTIDYQSCKQFFLSICSFIRYITLERNIAGALH